MPTPSRLPCFEDVCSDYSAAILAIIRRFNRDGTVEKDLHQEVLLKMWTHWASFDQERAGLYAWVAIITTHICIDYLRKKLRRKQLDQKHSDLKESAKTSCDPDSALHRHELMHLAGILSPGQRDVIVMIYFKGHTQNEASRLLKVPLGTVKSRQQAALLALRKMYGTIS